jgi:hypothetical protein
VEKVLITKLRAVHRVINAKAISSIPRGNDKYLEPVSVKSTIKYSRIAREGSKPSRKTRSFKRPAGKTRPVNLKGIVIINESGRSWFVVSGDSKKEPSELGGTS